MRIIIYSDSLLVLLKFDSGILRLLITSYTLPLAFQLIKLCSYCVFSCFPHPYGFMPKSKTKPMKTKNQLQQKSVTIILVGLQTYKMFELPFLPVSLFRNGGMDLGQECLKLIEFCWRRSLEIMHALQGTLISQDDQWLCSLVLSCCELAQWVVG